MKLKNSDITLLCKVVDNYGDIGVVFRLAKALSVLLPDEGAGLRLIVDNLTSFAQLSPGVDVSKPIQEHRGWTVCQWDAADEGRSMFAETPPLVILECFACGRPEWLDDILFDKALQALRPKPVQIINLEYLTAEPYADEFHKLQSLTRSAQVRKVNFMPGFTDKTGGLILDGAPLASAGARLEDKPFTVLVFSYERDFSTIAEALATFAATGAPQAATGAPSTVRAGSPRNAAHTSSANLRVLVAAGKADAPFSAAWAMCADRENENGNLVLPKPEKLAFLPQDEWDKMLYSADFLFIRGEDSLSRACLSGKPFVWHAYPQSEMYHLVKVRALLDRMEPFFSAENFRLIRDYWLWYNGDENFAENDYDSRTALIEILSRYDGIQKSFCAFSKNLIKNGNLAEHLMTFIEEIV